MKLRGAAQRDRRDNDTGPYRKTLLRASGVGKKFGELEALRSVDFDVPRHGIVSLIGPNGAGKTVFFNILTGLVKPDKGSILFDGKEITGQPPDKVTALGIARTFQNIRLFSNMTVLENVMVGLHTRMKRSSILSSVLRTQPMMEEEETARVRSLELLDFVGLGGMTGMYANNLPYGAGRRLEIARAIATYPQLLLLDEPTAGMNPQETADMIHLISRLRDEMGIAILLIEHDMKVVMQISERIAVLDYGLKIAEGTPAEVRASARVIEAYLGRGAAAQREVAPPLPPVENTMQGLQTQPKPSAG